MFIHKNKFNFIIAIAFLSSCSSMNVTEERVYSGDVKPFKHYRRMMIISDVIVRQFLQVQQYILNLINLL